MGHLTHEEARRLWMEVIDYSQSILSVEQHRVKAQQTGSTDDDMAHLQSQTESTRRRDTLAALIGTHVKEEDA